MSLKLTVKNQPSMLFYLAWYQEPSKEELEILKNICQCDLFVLAISLIFLLPIGSS